jgi:hypothetical protein
MSLFGANVIDAAQKIEWGAESFWLQKTIDLDSVPYSE